MVHCISSSVAHHLGGEEEQRGGRGRSASAGMCCRCVRTELLCSRRASDSFINITCSISGASPSTGEWESVSFTSSRRNVSEVKWRCVRVMLSVLGRELGTARFTACSDLLPASVTEGLFSPSNASPST